MNKCFLMTAVLSTAIAFSAYAGTDMKEMAAAAETSPSDAGFYVAAYGGAQFFTDYVDPHQTVSCSGGETFTTNNSIDSGWGGAAGLKGGYNFDSFPIADFMQLRLQPAVELEALWKGTTSTSSFSGICTCGCPIDGTTNDSFNSAAGFVNGIVRFKNSSFVTPYIGIGAGAEYITIHADVPTHNSFTSTNTHITGLDGSDLDFACQALVGLDFAIADHYSIFMEYKFIDAFGTDITMTNAGGGFYHFNPDQILEHLLVIGFKYTF